jgi:hypothetical protein
MTDDNTETHPLDGTCKVTTTTNYQGPIEKQSDGQTEIRNGQTSRYDKANSKWTSTFEIVDDEVVRMTSVADPREANTDFALIGTDGSPTRAPVTYESNLTLKRKGDKIQMSGTIEYAGELIFLTMRKIGD